MVCPLNGMVCSSGVRKDFPQDDLTGQKITCRWWIRIAGKDPQSERIVDHHDCSISWFPTLQIEGAQMTRQVVAGLDKCTNEIVKTRDIPIRIELSNLPEMKLLENGHS